MHNEKQACKVHMNKTDGGKKKLVVKRNRWSFGGVGNGTICVSVGMYIDSLGHLHD